MKNYISSGKKLTLTAPAGGVVSGNGYQIGQIFVVAEHDADAGEDFVGCAEGVFDLAKTSAQAWTEGQILYWDASAGEVTTVASANLRIGAAAAAAANPSATGSVRLDGVARADEPV